MVRKLKKKRLAWHKARFDDSNYRFHDHEKLAALSANSATDIEFNFFDLEELEGIHSRTDFGFAAASNIAERNYNILIPNLVKIMFLCRGNF